MYSDSVSNSHPSAFMSKAGQRTMKGESGNVQREKIDPYLWIDGHHAGTIAEGKEKVIHLAFRARELY